LQALISSHSTGKVPTSAVQQRKRIIASIHKRVGEDDMQSTGPSTKREKEKSIISTDCNVMLISTTHES